MKKFILLTIILCQMSAAAVANEANLPFWIGIVRIDGILVPIGTYDHDKWVKTWPEPTIDDQPEIDKLVKATDGKMRLQDIPTSWVGAIKKIPTQVYLWSEGSRPKGIAVLDSEFYHSHCSGGWVLKTNLSSREERGAPTPKVGIASNLDAYVNPFEEIKSNSKIAMPLTQAIKAKFEEKEKASRNGSQKERGMGSIELLRIYKTRQGVNGKSLYFITAHRKYPNPKNAPDSDCYDVNILNSWVLFYGNKASFLSSEFIITDCDGKEMNDIVPDAVITIKGRRYTVSENYGYEWESYRIHEILDGEMKEVLRVDGGGC
jgi:hypothetical protein